MNPKIISNYEDELFRLLRREELYRPEVYPCSKGVPTIGVGYALAEQSGGKFTVRGGIDEDLSKIGKNLTDKDNKQLKLLCAMLNNGTIKQAQLDNNNYKDPFDLTITEEEAKQLFMVCTPKYDAILREKLGLKLYKQLQHSHEMVALFSLAYNAPSLIGKNLVAGLREGNRAKVQYEILYGSNKDRSVGLDNRRKVEAEEFGRYDGEAPTPEELKSEEAVRNAHSDQIASYAQAMNAKRKSRTAKRATPSKQAHNNRKQQQKPGAIPNQKEVRKRTDQAKAQPHNKGNSILDRIMDLFGGTDKAPRRTWNEWPTGLDDSHYHKRWS